MELAPLALPPHPLALRGVPDSPAMQQEESLRRRRSPRVRAVQAVDSLERRRQELVVARHRLGGRVGPVGEEREAQVAVRIGEVVDLEVARLLVDVGLGRQQSRHDHDGLQPRRHAVA